MWLMLRAADSPEQRLNWLLYIVFATLTLYTFFLEAFIVAVHGLYIVLWKRAALRSWLIAVGIIAVLLIPWFGQIWALAHSSYQGTATHADIGLLFAQFVPDLLFSEAVNLGVIAFPVGLLLVALILWGLISLPRRRLLLLWLTIPTALLIVASTRLDVFRGRYLIAITPAILIALVETIAVLLEILQVDRSRQRIRNIANWGFNYRRIFFFGVGITPKKQYSEIGLTGGLVCIFLGLLIIPTGVFFANYYADYHKAPDWYSLRDFLSAQTRAGDTVIMTSLDPSTGYTDPAFVF